MSTPKPTILIIHGAWHTPAHYEGLKTHLESLGYPVELPALPTCNNDIPPTITINDDIALARSIAKSLVSSGKRVVCLMHSYGGVIGTAALSGLAPSSPSSPGLIALVYMTAFIPHESQSLTSMFADTGPPPFLRPNASTGQIDLDDPAYHFYTDVPASEQEKNVSMLTGHPILAQTTPIGEECAWRDKGLDVWYLVCDGDKALPPAVQDMMIEGVRKEGVTVKVERCAGSHSPFLSMAERVGEVVQMAAGGK
jgi:pimeloyl-ACP methyl ester carboxylesterase